MSRMKTVAKMTSAVFLALGLGLMGAACSGDNNPPDGGPDDGGDNGDQQCAVLCTTDADCCAGQTCRDGVCSAGSECPSGCNYECDKAANEICNQATKKCETGAPPVNCVSDCDCYSGEACIGGECLQNGGDDPPCVDDTDCEDGEVCRDGTCRPDSCVDREDCAGGTCLVCKDGQCTAPPPVCQGLADCCVGYKCNFGSCIPDEVGCQSDSDCEDPEFPRCKLDEHICVQECIQDIDCPLPGYVCIDNHCVSPGCTAEQCAQGEWCDQGDGECKPGCDSNDDCLPPNTCNYGTHECGQVDCCGGVCDPNDQYCDGLTCQCVDLCTGPNDCPPDYNCDVGTGQCVCTDAACPAGTHCDQASGQCVRDGDACDPADPNSCPAGFTCDPNQLVCISQGSGLEGDPCFTDAECDAGQNLFCDSNFWCFFFCGLSDPEWTTTMTCRYGCSLLADQCDSISAGTTCHMRWVFPDAGHPAGLCVPPI